MDSQSHVHSFFFPQWDVDSFAYIKITFHFMQCIYIRINVYQTKSNLEDKQRGLEATTRSTGTKHRHIYVAENECLPKVVWENRGMSFLVPPPIHKMVSTKAVFGFSFSHSFSLIHYKYIKYQLLFFWSLTYTS